MYNMIMGAVDGVLSAERLLEGIEPDFDRYVRPGRVLDVGRIDALKVALTGRLVTLMTR